MSTSAKIVLGVLSFLPFIFLLGYFVWFIGLFVSMIGTTGLGDANPGEMPGYFFSNMIWMIIWVALMGIFSLGLLIYYIVHVVNNKAIDSNERLVWILVFIFANMMGFPIYWYMRIWRNTPRTTNYQSEQAITPAL